MSLKMRKDRYAGSDSDDPDDPGYGEDEAGQVEPAPRGIQEPAFKRPRLETDRRESRASTTSSQGEEEESDDDEEELDTEAASLAQALESAGSSSEEAEETQTQSLLGETQSQLGIQLDLLTNGMGGGTREVEPASVTKPGNYSSMAERMMMKMGYTMGSGLGKAGQGRVEPVEISSQRGRRGLGLVLKGLETDQTIEWNSDDETVVVEEEVDWLPPHHQPIPPLQELRNWREEGSRKEDISDEVNFCHPEALASVMDAKTVFDILEGDELMKARTRSNPFETIRGAFFLNRAAMKMANLDAISDFMFTNPVTEEGRSLVEPHEPLYFADICSGPGGFSEYILWRRKWRAKGFGFTLKNAGHDFKLEDFYAGPPESFEVHYGVGGVEGDGNIFRPENMKEFCKFVMENTGGRGVHQVMADGGFCVEGQENIQEVLSKQLYLCQCIVALTILRPGGHFVCKLFDIFTPFSVSLIYLMYRSFQVVALHKPNTSRPANSERYLICKWKRPDCRDIQNYLFETNERLAELGFNLLGATRSETDVTSLVPDSVIMQDEEFVQYVKDSNNAMADRQVVGLTKIAAFCRNFNLLELRQGEIRAQCLHFWKVPDEPRKKPVLENPRDAACRLLGPLEMALLTQPENELKDMEGQLKSLYDWRCVVLGAGRDAISERTFFLGLGRSRVYMLDQTNMTWRRLEDGMRFDLSPITLLYGEVVREFRGEGKCQRRVVGLQVIDGMLVGGEDIRHLHFMERHAQLKLFLHSMNKCSRNDYIKLRLKTLYKLEDLAPLYDRCCQKLVKGGGGSPRLVCELEQEADGLPRYFLPSGLMLYRTVRDPYVMAFSKSAQRKYWFNTVTNQSAFELPPESVARFGDCHLSRLTWWWEGAAVLPDLPGSPGFLSRSEVDSFIDGKR